MGSKVSKFKTAMEGKEVFAPHMKQFFAHLEHAGYQIHVNFASAEVCASKVFEDMTRKIEVYTKGNGYDLHQQLTIIVSDNPVTKDANPQSPTRDLRIFWPALAKVKSTKDIGEIIEIHKANLLPCLGERGILRHSPEFTPVRETIKGEASSIAGHSTMDYTRQIS